jgi:formamidopyrimidine-DNA glycosylase
MPELPEVETIVNQLDENLAGKKIVGLSVLNAKSLVGNSKDITSQKIVNIRRRAKVVIMELTGGKYLLFHLKMTGQLIYIDHNLRIAGGHADHDWHAELPNSHTRIIFDLDSDKKLYFNDMRKFGWAKVMTKAEMDEYLGKYGPEPLPKLDINNLKTRVQRMKKTAIKKLLMDQGVVSGIGNIYADEILYASGIHPKRVSGSITDAEWKRLAQNTEKILVFAVEKGGTTDSDYVNAYGKKGGMQDYLKVYHHAGEACPASCGGKIERIVVSGRGTHFCPVCQKEAK